jgi:hypothetical protein
MEASVLMGLGRRCSEKPMAPRSISLLALLLFFSIMSVGQGYGQDCPFTEDEAIADTLDPQGYYPLEVGSIWEYTEMSGAHMDDPRREEVVKDTLIDGELFHKLKITTYQYDPDLITEASIQYRYITTTDTSIVHWLQGLLEENPIRFSQDFNSCYLVNDQILYASEGGYNRSFEIEESGVPVSYEVPAMKSIGSAVSLIEDYAYGIGRVGSRGDPSVITKLIYARIDGQAYGTPLDSLFDIRVATDEQPTAPRQPIHLTRYPNPFRSTAHLAFSLTAPAQVTLRISDVLGRVVARPFDGEQLSPGVHRVAWDAARLPAGLYLVQVVVGGQPVASTTLTLIR